MKWHEEYDYVVVGSGASGATAAVVLAEAGEKILVLEEGGWHTKEAFTEDVYGAMKNLFRDFGSFTAQGKSVIPVLEGCCVGGSTVMNGAIIHRMPEAIYDEWVRQDKKLSLTLPFSSLDESASTIERELLVRRNIEAILPRLPVATVLRKKNWPFQAMQRNATGCQGTGRCLQGCPTGGKWSMEKAFIPRAMQAGAVVRGHSKVLRIIWKNNTAIGVKIAAKFQCNIRARKGVIVAAGVIHSPLLLWRSGISLEHLGQHFQSHLGIGIIARMKQRVRELEGPPQGIEINAFLDQGVKISTQTIPPELLLTRTSIFGEKLVEGLSASDFFSSWTVSIRSSAEGRLEKRWQLPARLNFEPTLWDLKRVRQSLYETAVFLFEMGAKTVYPAIMGPTGTPTEIGSVDEAKRLLTLPLDARYYLISMGHLFGTCRLGSEPGQSVVDPFFRVRGAKNCFVVDASLFPTNLGVNPQHSVMSLARIATQKIIASQFETKAA